MSDSIEDVGIMHPLDAEGRRLFEAFGEKHGWIVQFANREQLSEQLDLPSVTSAPRLALFKEISSRDNYLHKYHFHQFRLLHDPSALKRTAGVAFHSLVDTRTFKLNKQSRSYPDQTGEPTPFAKIRIKTLAELGYEPIEYEQSSSEFVYRAKRLANCAIEVGSLIDSEQEVQDRIDRGDKVRNFTLGLIAKLKAQTK